jgi:DNA-binding LacI/PurR family transcriptional regulator
MKTGRRPTSHDVAKLAGVSQATVSIVLSNKARSVGIAESTVEKVRQAAATLSYSPNALMTSMLKGQTDILGVFARDGSWRTGNSYWTEAVMALHRSAAQRNCEVLLFSDSQTRSIEQLIQRMVSGLVDGVILQPSQEDEVVTRLKDAQIPVVCIGDEFEGATSIAIENDRSIRGMVDHLIDKGCQRLLHLTLRAPILSRNRRLHAFTSHCLQKNVSHSVIETTGFDHLHEVPDIRGALSTFDGVVCFNDEAGYELWSLCRELGIDVPTRLKITGFDGIIEAHKGQQLTTLRSPISEMCDRAVETIRALRSGTSVEPTTILDCTLVHGDST